VANIFVAASATWNGKALKKAKQDVSVFDKQVKKLGTTLLGVFSARALFNYSKRAVAAFAADEKAAKSLEVQLKNTGFAFSSPAVELYIANLQKATGVLDDQLRPAFQQLLTVTGSITVSQEALNTALNVSAATGKSLTQITTALSRAYAGNTTGLSRLGAGLDKALLKTGDMDKIMAELNNKFAGQAQARLTTYAGKMDLLRVASENVKEEIGKGILGALDALGKDTNLDETTAKMEKLGKTTGQTITGLGVLVKTISEIPGIGALGKAAYETSTFGLLARLARENQKGKFPTAPARETPAQGRILAAQRRQELKASQDLLKLKKQEVATLKAKTAIDQLKDKFDIERIGLTKALNEATDSETKLRLRAQLAILDNNEALAKKLLAEMEGKKATEELTTQFYALSEAAKNLLLSFGVSPSQIGPGGTITGTGGGGRIGNLADVAINNPEFGYSNEARALGLALGFTPGISRGGASQEIKITVDTAAAGDRMSQAIAESIQIATRNGYSTVPAGQGF
jgi:hypothetical protein